jgi:hypothetical protein
MQGFSYAASIHRRERNTDKAGQNPRIGGERSRKKSRTFAGCSARAAADAYSSFQTTHSPRRREPHNEQLRQL